jgi:hypothetical protein
MIRIGLEGNDCAVAAVLKSKHMARQVDEARHPALRMISIIRWCVGFK